MLSGNLMLSENKSDVQTTCYHFFSWKLRSLELSGDDWITIIKSQ
jgi:hypothetical protein